MLLSLIFFVSLFVAIPICDIIGSNPVYDIEHTIPRSISQDNSMMNKTLCSQKFNRDIKKNKMPIELDNYKDIMPRVEHWKTEADELTNKIEMLIKSTKNASTKEIKDRRISERHFLTLKRDYLQGKYERFIMKEPKVGFKNSQIPDTGIITKYAYAYLKSYFNRVEAVKGGMVSEFRKVWGIQESYIKDGFKYFKEKNRSKHTHHTIDAITIACMTKDKYDALAYAWTLEDKDQMPEARKILEKAKPWKTFTEDLKQIENEILVSHYTPDNVKKQSKKVERIRGKKQFLCEIERNNSGKAIPKKDANGRLIFKLDEKGNKIPKFQQGDTVRGSLHNQNFIGAIAQPEFENDIPKHEDGAFILQKDKNGEIVKFYVKRKPVNKDFGSESDIKNIVDIAIRKRIEKHGIKNIRTKEGFILLPAETKEENDNKKDLKEMLIRKIRLFEKDRPLEIKKQQNINILSEKALRKKHHHTVYAQNDGNYCMAIYEMLDTNGKIKRSNLLLNTLDAGKYFKKSNNNNKYYPIAPEKDENELPLKYILTKGKMVLIYDKSPKELYEISSVELLNRLFEITQLDVEKYAEIKLLHHVEAREKKKITEAMGLKTGMKGGKNIGEHKKYPWIKIGANTFDCLVEGYEFTISNSGKIIFK